LTVTRARVVELLAALAVVAADQATKAWVVASIVGGERREVVRGFFELTHLLNPGGVWGVGRELPPGPRAAVFLLLPVIVTVLAVWHSWNLPAGARWRRAAIALVVGGATGNLIDRLRLEPPAVIDFLLFHLGSFTWPAFNVADSAICVGFGILLVSSFAADEDAQDAQDAQDIPGGTS
jgi:signal peptidase II